MATNNVQTQLLRAQSMKDKVLAFAPELTARMEELENTLYQSVQAGFPEDIAQTYYSGYYTPDRETIDDLSNDMLSRHVDFLDRVIANLSKASSQR